MGLAPAHPSTALRGTRGAHLEGRTVALGVDGARGAPGAVRVARELVRLGAEVQPLVNPSTAAWVHPDALEYATGRAPLAWPPHAGFDAVLLAPAGPGLLAKLRHRLPDTAPAAAALAHLGRAPVLVAPAPGIEAAGAGALGAKVIPDAFTDHGEARPGLLAARVAGALSASPLRDRAALIVGAGAWEPWDAMRVVASRADPGIVRALRLELERRGARTKALLGPWASPHARDERAFESPRDLALLAALQGPPDVAFVQEGLPRLAPSQQGGKVPSGQEGLGLLLHAAPDPLAAARASARATVEVPAQSPDPAAAAGEACDAAERALREAPR